MTVRWLASIGAVLVLSACQSTPQLTKIPATTLDSLTSQWVIANTCYNSGDYSVDKTVNYRDAISYSLSTWEVDKAELERILNDKQARLSEHQSNNGLGTICKDWLLSFETTLSNVNNHKQQVNLNQQRQHELNKARASAPTSVSFDSPSFGSGSNTVQCSKIGDISINKNIQTFNGMVCPLGWLPYYGF